MKLALIMALPLSAFALAPIQAQADGFYRERIAPVFLCRDGSVVSTYNYQDPRYICALRDRARGEYLARVQDMKDRGFEQNLRNIEAIDANARKQGR